MELKKVTITNFRSIESVDLDFDKKCRVFVGINESGKSNILKALSFLDPIKKHSKVDYIREQLDEEPITESSIEFKFELDKKEVEINQKELQNFILSKKKDDVLCKKSGKDYALKDLCELKNTGLFTANIITEKSYPQYYTLGNDFLIQNKWKKPSPACPKEYKYEHDQKSYSISEYKFINIEDYKDIPPEYLVEAKREDISTFLGNKITDSIKKYLPKVLFWEYSENNILPSFVNIANFSIDPDTCEPLKNMFNLAGYDDIATALADARKGTDNQFQNFLDRIAEQSTKHLRSVWKELKNVEFSLRLNSDKIIPAVKDKNSYDFAKRSDGFKRFVTFLLMISINVKTGNLKDQLLIIDEPEISLHPTGARYLRDELIKISLKNYVAYSTYSIFMIDPLDIKRHYIVTKKGEVTSVEQAEESNISKEEVIYNALGYSVFQTLKKKNLIFEGTFDTRLFNTYLNTLKSESQKVFDDVGICHAKGAGRIRSITPFMQLAMRDCVVLSDADDAGKDEQRLYKKDNGYGKWLTYADVDSSIKAITGEDFIKKERVIKKTNEVLNTENIPNILDADLLDIGKIDQIKKHLFKNGISKEKVEDVVSRIKESVFEKFTSSDMEDSYSKMIEILAKKHLKLKI